jgi:WD40 repeat protein
MKIKTTKIAQLTGHNAAIYALANGVKDQHFISGAGEGWIVEWDLEAPELGQLLAKIETQVFSLCHLKEEGIIVAGNMNGGVHWVNLNAPEETQNILAHEKGVFGICQVGDSVITLGGQGKLCKWSIAEQRTTESIYLSHQSLRSIDYSEKRNEIAVGSSDNNIYLLDAKTLGLKYQFTGAHNNSVFSVRFHPTQPVLLSGGRDAMLKVWDLESKEVISEQAAHWFTINDIQFHPEGKYFATASRDKTVKIWDAQNYKLLKVLETIRDHGHVNSVNHLHWSKHHHYLISASDDRSMILWKFEEG